AVVGEGEHPVLLIVADGAGLDQAPAGQLVQLGLGGGLPLVHRHGLVAAAVQQLAHGGVGLGHGGGLGLGQLGGGGGGLAGGIGGRAGQGQQKGKSANGAEGAPEKRGMVLIHGLPPDRRGAGSSGPPAPIVEGRAPFVKNRSFVLPSFFKPVTDWPRPAACTGGQNAVYSVHEKRPGFPAPTGGTLPGALWRG